ncbi:HoxN/HupN/NixA family nickel/cobalt transporter [Pediococcus acidilactici]|uniref:HoxN/HupN/NixA family nickel/cobalt transporter n=1 Tax=Pediococcus acidilactici TaxID=1254 RepID=UPI00132644EB|nr:HoxN/HupN/NixA family nickel/cobalt transporter [Pediococcus acidilactici]KAF0335268.1 HoxN/HupN/NixA family nickel/cobalt transporter [Pediococcus acidilactici]KAF0347233.1 HoxN/HupN/NixA family nickel/cobalt transporter [Pediococcus acidilactici]KAF0394915.1 HoxN/HupN/NixA family nickel/cobalt transporter [Pediococcus acidilactici]KAF0398425.1 HoxN/HupN/NixA family nickel/cobalt transporter [Pediococcus acidilactici]KAF0411576.1 HoxN/HupN/NixA family nickel/cobalt transporter [Pediococcus
MRKELFCRSLPYYLGCLGLHGLGGLLILIAVKAQPSFWGLSILAYTLGLRHAFDADHIAAIDNTVRLLVHQKKKSYGVGFFFSLGHSTVVIIMALIVSISAKWARLKLPFLEQIGGKIGTIVSGIFLLTVAFFNLIILIKIYRTITNSKSLTDEEEMDELLLSRGLINKIISPLFKKIKHAGQMYPIGFLFGLGFDTATEIALIALSATATQSNSSIAGLIALPILFAAGMNLMDTTDSVMMSGAYTWAFDTPKRKAYYNLTVTLISVISAFFIGFIELGNVFTDLFKIKTHFSLWLQDLDLSWLGYGLVIAFIFMWCGAYLIWKFHTIKTEQA